MYLLLLAKVLLTFICDTKLMSVHKDRPLRDPPLLVKEKLIYIDKGIIDTPVTLGIV